MEPSIYDSLSRDAYTAAASLSVVMRMEQSISTSIGDYLNPHPLPSVSEQTPAITESDRLKIVDWCYSIVDQCQFDRETVAMTMELVDRFLSTSDSAARDALQDRKQFQLVAMSALYLSIKTNEKMALGSSFFAALSHGTYTVEDIEDMELRILHGLSWRIHAPTSVQIANLILSLALPRVDLPECTWGFILDEVRFQTEYAVRDYCFCTSQRPSTVALAAIFNTVDQLPQADRTAVLLALLPSLGGNEFAGQNTLKTAKSRLQAMVSANDLIGFDCAEEAVTVVSEMSFDETIAMEDAQSLSVKRGPEEVMDHPRFKKTAVSF